MSILNETYCWISTIRWNGVAPNPPPAPINFVFAVASRLTLWLSNWQTNDEATVINPMPPRWDQGNVKYRLYWFSNHAGGSGCTWEVAARSYGDGENMEQVPAGTNVVRAAVAGARMLHISPELSIAPTAGADNPAGLVSNFKLIARAPGTPWLIGVRIEWGLT